MTLARNIIRRLKNQFSFSTKINFKVVVLCIFGAATFWFFNALNKDYTSDLRIPLEFQFNDDENVVFGRLPGNVVVNVSGGGWDLLRKSNLFSLQPIEVPLADPAVQKKIAGVSLRPYVNTYLDGQLDLNYIVTDSLFLDIDTKITRMIKFEVDSTAISLAQDVVIVSPIQLERDSIRVTGAKRLIDTLSSPFVIRIPEADIDDDYDERLSIDLDDIENIDCEPNTIRIEFDTERLVTINNFMNYELVNFPEGSNIQLSDSTVQLEIKLRPQYRDSTSLDFQVIADYNLVSWEDSTLMPHIKNVPAYIHDVTIRSQPLKLLLEDAN